MTSERQLEAVVAHGLLNTVAVLWGSAHTLRHDRDRLAEEDRAFLFDALEGNSALFSDSIRLLVRHCSDPFGDAATVLSMTGRALRALPPEDLSEVLDGIIEGVKVVRIGLDAMVRGLPADVRHALDDLAT